MPDISGTNISAPIRPYHTDCTYPTAYADEIAGGLKYVASDAELNDISAERRPVGTVVSIGIGKFKQWTGSIWQTVLQGLNPPTVTHSVSEIKMLFGETPVSLKAVTEHAAGFMLPPMFKRLTSHGKNHLQDGDDALASITSRAGLVPQADPFGKISSGWLPFATNTNAGIVRVADDGTSPPDIAGTATAVLRATDSRVTQIPALAARIEELSLPIRYVATLPNKSTANSQVFYWLRPEETLYLLADNEWSAIAGRNLTGIPGKSAYEIARDQGVTDSIDEWLAGLRGANGHDGRDGKSVYDIALDDGFEGTASEWLISLKGAKGDPGRDGPSAYDLAKTDGFVGSLTQWLTSLKGAKGDKGDQGENGISGQNGAPGLSAYDLAREEGYSGTVSQWLLSLKGIRGRSAYESALDSGYSGSESQWLLSLHGMDGRSTYEIAQRNGYPGSEFEWLDSLRGSNGTDGQNGKSAYENAVEEGFTGTQAEWLLSLRGEKGEPGEPGEPGQTGPAGEKGTDGRGITILDYYESYLEFITEHPSGQPGDCYGVEGDIYLWAHDHWKNLGRIIGAIAFEFELLMEHAGLDGVSFEDFFRQMVTEAIRDMDFSSLIRTQVNAWMTEHFSATVSPIIHSWLNQNYGQILDSHITETVTAQLAPLFATHVSTYHEWLPI